MEPYKCAFSNTLITKQFGCEKGEQVTRRGGPDIACTSEAAHQRCDGSLSTGISGGFGRSWLATGG